LVQRVLTTSYIAVMEQVEQTGLMDEVANVIRHLPNPVELPYVTDVYRATAALR
jgi:hypothetical protein